jgi:SAM-dependent methyltransferase
MTHVEASPPSDRPDLGLYARQFQTLDIWGRTRDSVSAGERARVDAVVAAVPAGTRTVLEVGCGDGLVTNELAAAGYDVTGVDLVPELLRFVRTTALIAGADALPFDRASFDCVVASAVLEHLPAGVFEASLLELARVARRSIVVDSPHREDLVQAQARCGRCLTAFHASHHVRSVDRDAIASWFPGFTIVSTRLTGEPWPYRSRRLQRAAQLLGSTWYRGPGIVCPMCGYPVEPARPNPAVRAANGVLQRAAALLRGTRPSEIVVVLERRG